MFKPKCTYDETNGLRSMKNARSDNVQWIIYFVNVHNTLLYKPVSLNEAHIFLNIYVRLLCS